MNDDDKGWTMLVGATEPPAPANHYWRPAPPGLDAMIARYIASHPSHAELRAENEHLRLSLLTMAARERETAAERDALRTMLAEAREARNALLERACLSLIEESIACLAMTCEPIRSVNGALIDISRRLSNLVSRLRSEGEQ